MKITVVLLTWKRVSNLRRTLQMLCNQTYKNFEVYVSNGNLEQIDIVDRVVANYSDSLKIKASHDGNESYAFRRFPVGKTLAEKGTDIVFFIDDDVSFPPTYLEKALKYYEPKTYQSGFAWVFDKNGIDYYKYRRRVSDNSEKIHYCGTGVSMVDATIFLEKELLNAPKEAYLVEDLWLSYFAQHVLGWRLKFFPIPNTTIAGGDQVALYKQITREKAQDPSRFDKADFLRKLIKEYGWKL